MHVNGDSLDAYTVPFHCSNPNEGGTITIFVYDKLKGKRKKKSEIPVFVKQFLIKHVN